MEIQYIVLTSVVKCVIIHNISGSVAIYALREENILIQYVG